MQKTTSSNLKVTSMNARPVRWRYPAASDIKRIGKNRFAREYGILFANTEANNISQIGGFMVDFKNRIARIEARLQFDRDALSEEDHCAACAWFADVLETLDSGEDLAPADAAIWNDIFERGVDATRAWKNGAAAKTN